jgi:hypothetical protein
MFKNVLIWKLSLVLVISGCLWDRHTHSHYIVHASEFLTFFTHNFKQIKIPILTEETKKIVIKTTQASLAISGHFYLSDIQKVWSAQTLRFIWRLYGNIKQVSFFLSSSSFSSFSRNAITDLYFTGVNESLTKSRFSMYIQLRPFYTFLQCCQMLCTMATIFTLVLSIKKI